MNHYKHHIGDYMRDTAHLTMLEDCAYRRLIDLYYSRERALPADLAQCCKLARAASKEERRAVESVLAEFFTLGEDGYHQKRCDEEVASYQARAEHNRTVGVRGGRPKKTESGNPKITQWVSENNPNGFQTETQVVSENNPSHKPLTNNPPKPPLPPRRSRSSIDKGVAPPDDWLPERRTFESLKAEFCLSDQILGRYRDVFIDTCKAKGYRYLDFEAAFRNCVRQDWSQLRMNGAVRDISHLTGRRPDGSLKLAV